ncbi:MAG: glycosyltransferase family 2 protein [Thermodesulfobacteriota bacterium]|jgi:glycosyltransferase involved in cell wall biosynthesis
MADVVVPVFNEREILPLFLNRIEALPLTLNLIFIDNGSTDGTVEFLRARPGITLISHGENLGYGRSLIDGLLCSTSEKVIIIDADCEYPPEAIPLLLDRLATASVVYGSRFLSGGPVNMSHSRKWGNNILTIFFNLLYRQGLTDLYTGMKALRRETFQGLSFTKSGFEHVVELAACLALRGHRIVEIPIAYTPRQTGLSEMRHLKEGLKALRVMISYRLNNHGGN